MKTHCTLHEEGKGENSDSLSLRAAKTLPGCSGEVSLCPQLCKHTAFLLHPQTHTEMSEEPSQSV